MNRPSLLVAASIDVEEEGLFTGKYACKDLSLCNIGFLSRLEGLCDEGIQPTLFCAWPVFSGKRHCALINGLQKNFPLEIGCHLHHWNTPPFEKSPPAFLANVAACDLELELFDKKMAVLFKSAENCLGERPVSFRMGRWDLLPGHLAILARHGVKCDASIRPLHASKVAEKAPDHFNSPNDPYWLEGDFGRLFEVPLTVTPLFTALPACCDTIGAFARNSLKKWGALALLPVYHPLWLMKLVSRLHVERGGRVLSLTWHSSEMMPGGAPHVPDEKQAKNLLNKIMSWFKWLKENYNVESLTMKGIMERLGPYAPVETVEYCMNLAGSSS